MNKRIRKYYRVKVHRIPPYSVVNGSYYYEEDVYAYSKEGAERSVDRYHKNGYGSCIPVEVKEISKEEFRGNHSKQQVEEV